MNRYTLKDNHPDMIKLNRVCELMDELKMSFESARAGDAIVTIGDKEYSIIDAEDTSHAIWSFPPFTEFRLTFEK
jgi:hypothetical protein